MKQVLVIDDDDGVRASFRAALEDAGYGVTTADSGLAGLESARAQVPDLIFLDLKMPGLNGADTLRHLHAICPRTPVYVVTGFHGEFLAPLRALQNEGIDFNVARKPLSASEIKTIAAGGIGSLGPLTVATADVRTPHGARS